WVVQATQTVLVARSVDPSAVGVDGVYRDAENFCIQVFEFFDCIAQCDDLSWAYKGKVQWIEEHYQPFATVVGQGYFAELFTVSECCFQSEIWCWETNQ